MISRVVKLGTPKAWHGQLVTTLIQASHLRKTRWVPRCGSSPSPGRTRRRDKSVCAKKVGWMKRDIPTKPLEKGRSFYYKKISTHTLLVAGYVQPLWGCNIFATSPLEIQGPQAPHQSGESSAILICQISGPQNVPCVPVCLQ